ncbi:Hsp20/alpha crystallin family protein [Bacillus sp. FJAT-22090]|uniref:Hsp20/alpha crystallin family protein n=1 Tax=Bacillus sp. FJAT-22090 TaxID=1581038 RepID=UPI00164250C5|nr:Hsp20/alpha crystallin family protein [Bacillus sp. FJAT-22090]
MPYGNDHMPARKNNPLETFGFRDKPLWNLMHQMDSFFNQFFNQLDTHFSLNSFQVNTHENESDVIVEVKLPGIKQNQIQLEIIENKLKISVEDSLQEEIKYPNHTGKRQVYQRREQYVSLPFLISENEAKISFDNELLTVSFPKQKYFTLDE